MGTTRRSFLTGGLAASLGLSMRAAATGLPVSFLLDQKAVANFGAAKFCILSCSSAGEAINNNGPLTYDAEFSSTIDHPVASENAIIRNIGGRQYSAADLANAAPFWNDANSPTAARCYTALDNSFKESLVWFNHRTKRNAHAEFSPVLDGNGAVKNPQGTQTEMIHSAIAQETHQLLGTLTDRPVNLSEPIHRYKGAPLIKYNPRSLKDSLTSSSDGFDGFDAIFNSAIDDVYKLVKQNGSPEAMRFLDNHALTAEQAKNIGSDIGSLIEDITENTVFTELKMALALAKLRIAPVVIVKHSFSQDNHNDRYLEDETGLTLDMIGHLNAYWDLVQQYGMQDEVMYATLDVFGRTMLRNSQRGRNHHGDFSSGLIHAHSSVKGQLIGGLINDNGDKGAVASGINSSNGTAVDPDIEGDDTLSAYFKTLMAVAGVPSNRLNVRIPSGKVVGAVARV